MGKTRRLAVFFSLLLALACADENELRLNLGGDIKQYLPNYSQAKRFVSNTGDTITLKSMGRSQEWEKINEKLPAVGGLSGYDYLLLETQKLRVGSDTPYLRFNFELKAQYAPQQERLATDLFSLTFEDGSSELLTFGLDYIDSVKCSISRCNFTDTLKVLNRTFLNCYFTPRDSTEVKAIYLNSTQGLIGFRSSTNQIFELID
jgi:hypothetical protein